jgi:endonuclease/exonuclease/phosphatase family metal-dependent hydrolase
MYRRSMFSIALLFIFFSLCQSTNVNDTQCPTVNATNHVIPAGTPLRLMQYNVEWFFLKTYNGCPGTSCSWETLADATTHMQYIANVVKEYDPDILNLCEVEGCYELGQLNGLLGNAYQPYLLYGTDTSTGQNVGLMTKWAPTANLQRSSATHTYPVTGSHCDYSGTGSSGVSKHYYTSFKMDDLTVYLIGAHLLAIPTEPSRCASREAQASVLQELIVSLLGFPKGNAGSSEVGIILMGDLNDFDGVTLDSNSDMPTSNVLNILKGAAGDYAGTYTLETAAQKVTQSERYTDWWDPNGDCKSSANEMSMIDHVLMTPNLMDKVVDVFMPHPYSEYCGTFNSDHYPIIVDMVV